MRLGDDDNFLSLEVSISDLGGFCVAEAGASYPGRRFTARHDCLRFDSSPETFSRLSDFESLKTAQMEISFSEGGWLRFLRDSRGWITVKYRIAGWRTGAAMEGEILVEGEFAGSFCREVGALLRGRK